ncbi:Uncharacterised protein [Mycobacterium tuberculosis]|uniref:Uncharacterized protein n=1 Tax=Mycobacterium tuberculosis TaxID=1773 RepID=A0A654TZ35_MYCTX|nr:Uncharacterised protein [Mycobacterium tuberculosis]CKR87555.1 Uncharacterised protein [Mycobacterium tuberculosis]
MFLISRANILPRRASTTAFLCLVVAHLEWPLIAVIYLFCCSFARRVYVGVVGGEPTGTSRHKSSKFRPETGAFATAHAAEVTMSTNN